MRRAPNRMARAWAATSAAFVVTLNLNTSHSAVRHPHPRYHAHTNARTRRSSFPPASDDAHAPNMSEPPALGRDAASPTSVSPAPRREPKQARPRSPMPPPRAPDRPPASLPPRNASGTPKRPAARPRPCPLLRPRQPPETTAGSRRVVVVAGGAADSRASSATFSAASFSSSVTSASSTCDVDKQCAEQTASVRPLVAETLSPPSPLVPEPFPPCAPSFEPLPDSPQRPAASDERPSSSSSSSEDADSQSDNLSSDDDSQEAIVPGEPRDILEPEPSPTPPLPPRKRHVRPMSAAEFRLCLDDFVALNISALGDDELYENVRYILDLLDFLTDKIPLNVATRLFNTLAQTNVLIALITLMQDVSVRARPRYTFEALKQFRYPYVVGSILVRPKLADTCLSHPVLIDKILDVLDKPAGESADAHPIVLAHVANVVATYLEYSPDPLLERLETRPSFLPGLVRHLHLAPVVELISSLIPSRCVDAVSNMDPAAPNFEPCLKKALGFLAQAKCFHMFADSFENASEKAVDGHALSMQVDEAVRRQGAAQSEDGEEPVSEENVKSALYNAEQVALNSIECYQGIVRQIVRIVRIDTRSSACKYLNSFDNPSTATTMGKILDAGIESYEKSEGTVSNFLVSAVDLATSMLKAVEADSAKRVASVAGPPPPLSVSALSREISARLTSLTMIATDGRVTPRLRMHILEMMGMVQSVGSAEVFDALDQLRFGEVAFRMVVLHARNSLLHNAVVRTVESALLSDSACTRSRRHWLVNSRLVEKLMRTWRREHGAELWQRTDAPRAPLLSAIAQMACAVHHWIACDHASSRPGERGTVRALLGDRVADAFTAFFVEHIASIVELERRPLAGERPSRARSVARQQLGLSSLRRTDSNPCGMGTMSKWSSSRSGVHLVRSPSAHRFGFTEPVSYSARSRFANIFADDDPLEADNGNDFGLSLLDTVAFIRNSSDTSSGSPNGVAVNASQPMALTLGGLQRSPSMVRASIEPNGVAEDDPFGS